MVWFRNLMSGNAGHLKALLQKPTTREFPVNCLILAVGRTSLMAVIDEVRLLELVRNAQRLSIQAVAGLAFFFSVISPDARRRALP
jgi:hypothetical protein